MRHRTGDRKRMIAVELGTFAAGLEADALPAGVADAVKHRVLDVLAAGLAGYQLDAHRQLLPILQGPGEATVWGAGNRLSLRDAVLVNSFLAHCTYMDDGDRYSGAHPGAVVIPSALALAETRHLSGAKLIAAIAAGYEVLLRVGRAIYPSAVVRGFQSTAILGAIGSAAACANLLRLSAASTKNAIGLSCNLGVGLKDSLKCSASQPLQVARACEGGLFAALYAQQGAEAPDGIVENGFIKAFADQKDTSNVLSELGTHYRIFDTYIKVHGGCRGNHSPTDAVMDLIAAHGIALDDIESISVSVDSVTMAGEIHEPTNGTQAQFCVPFAIAVALLEGNASIFQFTDDKLTSSRIRALMQKIHVQLDKGLDAFYPDKRGAIANIRLNDGRSISLAVDNAKGEPEYPLSAADIVRKFDDLAASVLGQNTSRVRDMVMNLDKLDDVAALLSCLKLAIAAAKGMAEAH
jgi:2-methylcitrate dehydratase PrpD